MTRREFLRSSLAGTAALVVTGCRNEQQQAEPRNLAARPSYTRHTAEQTGPTRAVRLVAEPAEVEVGSKGMYRTWLYNGEFPGPEIRVGARPSQLGAPYGCCAAAG